MAQLLRIEFPGAVYHATSRGDRLEPIFADDSGAEARHVARDAEAAAQPAGHAPAVARCLRLARRGAVRAQVESGLSMTAIARELGLSVSRVSRLIARAEQDNGKAG